MSSKVAWLILSGLVLALPFVIFGIAKYFSLVYNLFF